MSNLLTVVRCSMSGNCITTESARGSQTQIEIWLKRNSTSEGRVGLSLIAWLMRAVPNKSREELCRDHQPEPKTRRQMSRKCRLLKMTVWLQFLAHERGIAGDLAIRHNHLEPDVRRSPANLTAQALGVAKGVSLWRN